jgi:predicted Zn-dependent protease
MAPRGESHELQHDASPTVFVERAHAVRLRIDDLCQRRLAERWHSGARIEHCGLDEEFYCDSLDDGDVVLAAAGAARAGLVVEDELRHVLLLAREASWPHKQAADAAHDLASAASDRLAELARSSHWEVTAHLSQRLVSVWHEEGAILLPRCFCRLSVVVDGVNDGGHATYRWVEPSGAPDQHAIDCVVADAFEQSERLRTAEPPRPRVLPAVLAPDAASAVSHELVGHLLEADNWETARGFLGDRRNLGPSCLNVTERASAEHGWGAFQRDDEGMPTLSTPLVRNGEIVDQLVNKHHAAVRGSRSNGHGIRASHRDPAIPRFGRLETEPSTIPSSALIADMTDGIFIHSISSGEVSPKTGRVVLRIREAWDIEHGRRTTIRRGGTIVLDARTAFDGLIAVGDDLTWFNALCRKQGQDIPVADGAPSFFFSSLSIS